MSQARIGLVLCSFFGVFEYSHDLMQKKQEALIDDALAFSLLVVAVRSICR